MKRGCALIATMLVIWAGLIIWGLIDGRDTLTWGP